MEIIITPSNCKCLTSIFLILCVFYHFINIKYTGTMQSNKINTLNINLFSRLDHIEVLKTLTQYIQF